MPNNKDNQKGINPNCSCPKISCRRHGDCKACKRHHRNDLTFCQIEPINFEEINMGLFHSHFHRRHGKIIAYKILCELLKK